MAEKTSRIIRLTAEFMAEEPAGGNCAVRSLDMFSSDCPVSSVKQETITLE